MFLNAYAKSMGNSADLQDVSYEDLEGIMLDETLATGYFNEPLFKPLPDAVFKRLPELAGLSPYAAQQRLWAYYCSLTNADRVELIKEITGARTSLSSRSSRCLRSSATRSRTTGTRFRIPIWRR